MTYGTMEIIQTVNVGSGGAANIDFTSIPQTYNDLYLVASTRSDGDSNDLAITFNTSGGTYSGIRLVGNGTSAASEGATNNLARNNPFNWTNSSFASSNFYIPNYTGSSQKSISVDSVSENNATLARSQMSAGLWNQTSAITRITLTITNGQNLVQHSTATLYGITRVPAGAKATGGVITDDASYWYHAFTSSGTFTPSQSISADILVVAGGGGSGWHGGGGGGAGGLLGFSNQSLLAQNYAITIGAGGAGGVSAGYPNLDSCGRQGSNSIFGSLTTVVGGGGGHGTTYPGTTTLVNGGSGGGQSGRESAGQNIGTGTSGQGSNGGAGNRVNPNVNEPSGGGGGAGAVGGNASSGSTGSGGNGVSTYSDWGLATGRGQNISGTVWFAGGGAGGNWGSGTTGGSGGNGGGAAAPSSAGPGVSGTANTGGGASGGVGSNSAAGNGGSGLVIVRYAK